MRKPLPPDLAELRLMTKRKLTPIEEVVRKPEQVLAVLEYERDHLEARERRAHEREAQGRPQLAKLLRQA
jgi:hypothetical protein